MYKVPKIGDIVWNKRVQCLVKIYAISLGLKIQSMNNVVTVRSCWNDVKSFDCKLLELLYE